MTRLAVGESAVKEKAGKPNFAELMHDLTEVVGQLVCGFPLFPSFKPFDLPCIPKAGGCSTCGGVGCGECGGGSAGGSCGCGKSSCNCGGLNLGSLCKCEPPCWPCWLPERLNPAHLSTCPGSAIRVVFNVSNLAIQERKFFVAATGPDAALASGAPSVVTVDPMGHGRLVAVVKVPATVAEGAKLELTLWVRGAFDHVAPVVIAVTGGECDSTTHRHITEQPDTCHTWRDHFYVSRSLTSRYQG